MELIFDFYYVILFSSIFIVSASEEDYIMKDFDKGYITFVFDDNNSMFTNECYQVFKEYNMPMCCAVIANQVEKNPSLITLLKDIENDGGEILSHTYDHTVFVEGTPIETVEYQLKQSFVVLKSLGFNVNGIIETGNGGGEKTADYEMIESVTRKYYKYSNAYGVSSQYNKSRIWFFDITVESMKTIIDKAVAEKQWFVLSAHNFKEMPKEDLIEILNYINAKDKENIEVVNWNYIYENFFVVTK
jgi:peptidoglycan/xylan/chitin deacetylase (PgdA/CDA1 family)